MGIGINLREEVTVILPTDDAIAVPPDAAPDVEPSVAKLESWSEYQLAGYDESKLVIEGEPTRFRLRRMTYDQRKRADDINSVSERVEWILRCCLVGVSGLKVIHDSGALSDVTPLAFDSKAGREMVKLSWLRETNLPPSVMSALAVAAKSLSECNVPFPEK